MSDLKRVGGEGADNMVYTLLTTECFSVGHVTSDLSHAANSCGFPKDHQES